MIRPRLPLPAFDNFTIEPKLAVLLEELVLKYRPQRILELGSGTSTVVMAYALEKNGRGTLDAVEDNAEFAESSRELVRQHKLDAVANIYDAPLTRQTVAWDGMAYPWYNLNSVPPGPYDFIFVDGPVNSKGTLARWPAYHLLKSRMTLDAKLLVDDTKRVAENIMITHWTKYDERLTRTDLLTDRGAALLERIPYAQSRGTKTEKGSSQERAYR